MILKFEVLELFRGKIKEINRGKRRNLSHISPNIKLYKKYSISLLLYSISILNRGVGTHHAMK